MNAKAAKSERKRLDNLSIIITALLGTIKSRAWRDDSVSPDQRVGMLITALCDAIGGGKPIYLPTGPRVRELLAQRQRNQSIRDAFDGSNHASLAEQHGLTVRQVRNVLKKKVKRL